MITINDFGDATAAQKASIQQAVGLWARVWDLPAFQDRVLNFRGGPEECGFSQNSDSNQEVWRKITAHDPMVVSYAIDPSAHGSETASTDPGTGLTTIEARWIDSCEVFELVNTLSHEYTHTPDGGSYKHSRFYSRWVPGWRTRPWSVPYGIGGITEELARALP